MGAAAETADPDTSGLHASARLFLMDHVVLFRVWQLRGAHLAVRAGLPAGELDNSIHQDAGK